ncbi:DNA translocase FtsK [Lederbergia wuyishanensis]|uniref:DNA translocase FtsK n=1 Tax=Lederbergia wuyishanensis TaxID=1347903 RepID=UPI001FCFFC2A|nr:DNA translocase FtsK [Lederbergia wuyishanensis]MCJ8009580.1 DNA translocase FtsK [Lederbergia wuyishanensis]
MSWFKKLFSKLTMEEIEKEQILESKHIVQHTEMDTRMMYQYPKGQFRFPLIEDPPRRRDKKQDRTYAEKNSQNQNSKNEPTRIVRKQRELHSQKIVKQEERVTEQRGSREVNEKKLEKVESRKVEPIMKQPFRATKIPSPIYGFDRPEKQDLEYELKDSFIVTNDDKLELHFEENKEEPIIEDFAGVFDLEEDNFSLENSESVKEDYVFLIDSNEFESEDDVDLGEINELETEDEVYLSENNELETEDEVYLSENNELETEDEVYLSENNELETEEDEYLSENDELETEEDEYLSENDELDTEDHEYLSENDEFEAEDHGFVSENEELGEKVRKFSDEIEDINKPQLDEEPILESDRYQQENTKQRSHLPFNVLMLKKDKEKWQQRQLNLSTKTKMPEQTQIAKAETATAVQEDITSKTKYNFPSLSLLQPPILKSENRQWLEEQKELLSETLKNFNVNAHVVNVSQGPAVTRFEVQPERGVKVSKITNLSDDIKLSMAAKDIRIEAPIPGKRSIGIEIPNHESRPVQISEIIGSNAFVQNESPLTAVLGLDISGVPVVTDLRRMPHGLIAGATGSGKSVCINSILVSLLYKAKPEELKLLLIDPKMVELAPYNHIPHLVSPVITDVKAATAALKWAVDEMERRYELFAHATVRDIGRFNELATESGRYSDKLPYIVVVIDELADLMMMAPTDVEESICRIAQKARACGIHLIIATQRPSVDVITGLIKANVPTRIAFSVSSQVDSRTIIDISGAEKLLGRGDMLFLGSGSSKPVRLQGTFVSDQEIDHVVEFVRTQGIPNYLFEQEELLKKAQVQEDEDELFVESCDFVVNQGSASTSLLQRQFRIGYNRAARLILMMEQQGIISEAKGSKPRDVLINERELIALKNSLE